jgi:hypothetical protein
MHGGRAETSVGKPRPQRANPQGVSDVGRGSLQQAVGFRLRSGINHILGSTLSAIEHPPPESDT